MSSTNDISNHDTRIFFPLERIISVEDLAERILSNSITNKALNSKPPRFSLFLGAGASRTSNIKDGGQMIKYFVETLFARERKHRKNNTESTKIENEEIELNSSDKSKEERKEIEKIIFEKKKEFLKKIYGYDKKNELLKNLYGNDYVENEYSYFFGLCYPEGVDRRDYIRSIIEPANISWGYIQLANLIERNVFRNILTTNFDDLVYQTCTSFTDIRPIVFSYGNLATEVTFSSDRPQIFKLHGDFLYTSLKNLHEEINEKDFIPKDADRRKSDSLFEHLKDKVNMVESFKQSLKDRSGIVVIGYSGGDKSIMEIFHELPTTHYLIWCIYWNETDDKQPITWNWLEEKYGKSLVNLLKDKNGYLVKIKGFDDVMSTICKAAEIVDDDIIFTAIKRITKLRNTLYNSKREPVIEIPDTDKTEKEKLTAFKHEIDKVLLATSYFFSGYDHYLLNEYEEAEECYKKSIDKYEKFADVYFNYGNLLAKNSHRHLEAIDMYNNAIKLNPSDAYAYNRLGLLLTNYPSNIKEARINIEKAIEFKPDYDFAYYNLGNWLLQSGNLKHLSGDYKEADLDFDRARENFERASEINAKSVEYLISLIAINHILNRKDEIPGLVKKLKKIIKDHDFYNWACFYSVTGERNLALQYLEQAVKKDSYNGLKARNDLNFDGISSDPKFKEIIDK